MIHTAAHCLNRHPNISVQTHPITPDEVQPGTAKVLLVPAPSLPEPELELQPELPLVLRHQPF